MLLGQKNMPISNNENFMENKNNEDNGDEVNPQHNIEVNPIDLTKNVTNITNFKNIENENKKSNIDENSATINQQNEEKQLQNIKPLNSIDKENTGSQLQRNGYTTEKRCRTQKSNSKKKQISKQRKNTDKKLTITTKRLYKKRATLTNPPTNYINLTEIESSAEKAETQIMKNLPKQYYNMNLYKPPLFTLNAIRNSQLPEIYPAHFEHQLHPTETTIVPQNHKIYDKNCSSNDLVIVPQENYYPPTPDFSQAYEINTSSSTLSLPESLHGVFDSNNIREILNAEKIVYHLNEHHTKVLAMVFDLNVEHLNDVLNKIVNLDNSILQEVEEAYSNLTDTNDTSSSTARTRPFQTVNNIEKLENTHVRDNKRALLDAWFPSQRRTQ
ncbi:myb-like protein I [Teleopsis dalmanni]|nr:myb-like protein I [Teleopsis dalmanni]